MLVWTRNTYTSDFSETSTLNKVFRGTQVSEQVAQEGCGVPFFGDAQKPILHGPEQSALSSPVLNGRPSINSTIL